VRIARRLMVLSSALVLSALAAIGSPALAQSVADFYRGKNLDLYIGYSIGGGYDIYARVLARHIARHIPGNPTVIPRNMDGAGSLRLANWLYTAAPKDGTAIGIIGRGTPFDPLLGRPGIQFEAVKYSWIGSANNEVSVCVSSARSGVVKFDDMKSKEIIVGAAGVSSDDDQFPRIINGVFGTKMRVVSGYPGGNDVVLAMERGEVNGRCGWSWSSLKSAQSAWLTENKIHILAQLALSKHADLPNVPLIVDLAQTDEQRQILRLIFARQGLGRPFLGPPGIPQDRLQALREAFDATMMDREFLAEADKLKMEINPLTGVQVENLVRQVYAETPPDVAKRAASLLP
jgi:tripartite-type tricarboxylate transporter receptor subunit TctC